MLLLSTYLVNQPYWKCYNHINRIYNDIRFDSFVLFKLIKDHITQPWYLWQRLVFMAYQFQALQFLVKEVCKYDIFHNLPFFYNVYLLSISHILKGWFFKCYAIYRCHWSSLYKRNIWMWYKWCKRMVQNFVHTLFKALHW